MPATTRVLSRPDAASRAQDLRTLQWIRRAAYAAPLVGIAMHADTNGYQDGANTDLIAHARAVVWGSRSLGFVASSYPPIPTAIARLLPSGLALGVVGALAGGVLLEAVHRRIRKAGIPLPITIVLVALLALSPGFAFTATTNLATFLAVAFLAVAIDGFVRFVHAGQTHGGFRAGLALGLAGLCHPAAIVCAVGFAASAPLIAHQRYRGRRAAGRATAAVLLFPTVAGLLGWTFLCWRFAGSPLVWLHTSAPELFHLGGVGQTLSRTWHGVELPLALTPLLFAVIVVVALTRGVIPAAGLLVPGVALALTSALGLGFGPGAVAAILGVVALTSLPRRLPGAAVAALVVVGVGGLVLKWTVASSPALVVWEHALTR